MKKFLLSILVLALTFAGARAETIIKVAGISFTSNEELTAQLKDKGYLKSGSVSFDGGKIITLENADIEMPDNVSSEFVNAKGDLYVTLIGANTIKRSMDSGALFMVEGSLTFNNPVGDSGTLKATSRIGFNVKGENSKLIFTGGSAVDLYAWGAIPNAHEIYVNNSSVTIEATQYFVMTENVSLITLNEACITDPEDVYTSNGRFYNGNGTLMQKGKIVIKPSPIKIADIAYNGKASFNEKLRSEGYLRNGTISYNGEKVVFDNVELAVNTGFQRIVESMPGSESLYLDLHGNNSISGGNSTTCTGFDIQEGDLIISGNGTLNVKSAVGFNFAQGNGQTMTIRSSATVNINSRYGINYASAVNVYRATLNIEARSRLFYNVYDINLAATYIDEPAGGYTEDGEIYSSDGTLYYAGKLTIKPKAPRNITIAGIEFSGSDDITARLKSEGFLKSGSIIYDGVEKLTLDGATFEKPEGTSWNLVVFDDDLVVDLQGPNKFDLKGNGVNGLPIKGFQMTSGNLTLTGTTLTINGENSWLASFGSAGKTLTVEKGSVIKFYGLSGIVGFYSSGKADTKVKIDKSELYMEVTRNLCGGVSEIEMINSFITTPAGAYYDNEHFYDSEGNAITTNKLKIIPRIINIAKIDFSGDDDITARLESEGYLKSGTITYDGDETITLEDIDFEIPEDKPWNFFENSFDITVNLVGTNKIFKSISNNGGVCFYKPTGNLTITGEGTLDVAMAAGFNFAQENHQTFTIEDGCTVLFEGRNGIWQAEKVVVDNSTFSMDANVSFCSEVKDISLVDAYIESPAGVYTENGTFYDSNNQQFYKGVLIIKPKKAGTPGDVNDDGDINSGDVVAVYKYIIEGGESGITADKANVNGDAEVNSADVVAIYNIIINGN